MTRSLLRRKRVLAPTRTGPGPSPKSRTVTGTVPRPGQAPSRRRRRLGGIRSRTDSATFQGRLGGQTRSSVGGRVKLVDKKAPLQSESGLVQPGCAASSAGPLAITASSFNGSGSAQPVAHWQCRSPMPQEQPECSSSGKSPVLRVAGPARRVAEDHRGRSWSRRASDWLLQGALSVSIHDWGPGDWG